MTKQEMIDKIARMYFRRVSFGKWEEAPEDVKFRCHEQAEDTIRIIEASGLVVTEPKSGK